MSQLIYSLPFQLVFHHFKKNLALLLLWGIIIGAFSGGIGKVYGIHYLFLDPEYLGKVDFWSFFIVGFSLGNFIISFHITSYILDSHRFRFIGILEKPFTKFSINNSLVPLLTLVAYAVAIINFQLQNEYEPNLNIFFFLIALLLGILSINILMYFYFRFTNKDIFKYLSGSVDKTLKKSQISRGRVMNKLKESREGRYNVKSYLDLKLRLRPTDQIVGFRDKEAVLKVFDQNHFNSVVVELVVIGIILALGFFMNATFLQIPAAASCLLILSIAMMLIGAISYWFKGWGLAFAVGLFVLANMVVTNGLGKGIHEATGINYDTTATEYSVEKLLSVHSKEQFVHDKLHMLETLEKWKKKHGPEKQKMIFLCVSGGGQRAALWTVNSLLEIDSALQGSLMDQSFLITGASGGIIGAAYYREMFLRHKNIALGNRRNELLSNIGKDNLNPVIFSLLVNDLFFKIRTHEFVGKTYSVDRGYTFERNLNKNLGDVLDKKVMDYYFPETNAEIPLLLMSPTISNDGRKLYISSQPMTFMTISSDVLNKKNLKVRGADFMTFFRQNDAQDLHFLSALRMSASFPYITPNISLPSNPRIEIMDAGISDNFGVADALRFIYVFKDWLKENTDGIILLTIRDSKPNSPIKPTPNPSIIDRFTYPIASVYNNLGNMQDIKNDARIERLKGWFDGEVDLIEIAYDSDYKTEGDTEVKRASLSWHLTSKEKTNLIENIEIESNQKAINALKGLLK